jgi:hypothetical protein
MTRYALALVFCAFPVAVHGQQSDAQKFVGTWRLVSIQADSLAALARSGNHPTGYIYYDATGHMAAQIQPDRQRPSWTPRKPPTAEQARQAVTGYTAYFGTYTVDPVKRTVTHHREGALNLDVVDYVRRYEFLAGDRIALMPVDRPGLRLVWERVSGKQ